MSRIAALSLATLALMGGGLVTAAQAGAADEGEVYQRYADVRERLYACFLESESGWNTQDSEMKADCRALRRYYVLYGWTGEGYVLHVHCRSPKHCLATPSSEPRADGPIPAGATIYDVKIAKKSAKKKKAHKKRRHRHTKSRSRRSRAAHGSAAATR